jgi:hypothetical protein
MPNGGSATWSSKWWPAIVRSPPTGTTVKMSSAGRRARYGASLKTNRSARSGMRSSLKNSLTPSASVWSSPYGPARLGPIRLCMSLMTLRSNQIINMTETMRAANAARTLMTTINSSTQWAPWANSGSVRNSTAGFTATPAGLR